MTAKEWLYIFGRAVLATLVVCLLGLLFVWLTRPVDNSLQDDKPYVNDKRSME